MKLKGLLIVIASVIISSFYLTPNPKVLANQSGSETIQPSHSYKILSTNKINDKKPYHVSKGNRYNRNLTKSYGSNGNFKDINWYINGIETVKNKVTQKTYSLYHINNYDKKHGGWVLKTNVQSYKKTVKWMNDSAYLTSKVAPYFPNTIANDGMKDIVYDLTLDDSDPDAQEDDLDDFNRDSSNYPNAFIFCITTGKNKLDHNYAKGNISITDWLNKKMPNLLKLKSGSMSYHDFLSSIQKDKFFKKDTLKSINPNGQWYIGISVAPIIKPSGMYETGTVAVALTQNPNPKVESSGNSNQSGSGNYAEEEVYKAEHSTKKVHAFNPQYYGLNTKGLMIESKQWYQYLSFKKIFPSLFKKYYRGQTFKAIKNIYAYNKYDFSSEPNVRKRQSIYKGTTFKVTDIIIRYGGAKFKLSNGKFVTANTDFVKRVK